MLLVEVCEKLYSEFSAYEGFHVIEMGIESWSKCMYACSGGRRVAMVEGGMAVAGVAVK